MAAPTYAQIMAELALWKANPNTRYINGQKLVDLLTQYINHLTNTGAYDPGTFMQQVVGVIGDFPSRFTSLSTTLYVNQATGNDANTGTSAAPLKTLGRVAQMVNGKFSQVSVSIVGNYTLNETIRVAVPDLKLSLSANASFTFAKRSVAVGFVGETLNSIFFEGVSLCFEGSSTSSVVLEDNAGYTSGDTYTYRASLGAIQAGNSGINYYDSSITFNVFSSIKVGNNCVLLTARSGTNHLDSKPRHALHFNYISAWTLGTGAMISPWAKKSYLRRSLLFDTANTWKSVGNASEICLQTGMYAVKVYLTTHNAGGQLYLAYFSGVMTWYNEGTNDSNQEGREITLHAMGHILNSRSLKLRTVTTSQSTAPAAQSQRLEAQINETLSSPITLEFTFSKLD